MAMILQPRSYSVSRSHSALQAFSGWVKESMVEVVVDARKDEKATFVPIEKIRSYFTANGHEHLNQILQVIFESQTPLVDAETILFEHTAVFCILLHIGKGRYIEQVVGFEELSDRRLPFNETLKELSDVDDDPAFVQRFCQTQWLYCVPRFDHKMLNKRFGEQRILPITHQILQGTDGLAEVSQIKLYGPYNKMMSSDSVRTNRLQVTHGLN